MKLVECYEKLNGDYNDAKARLISDKIIEKFMLMFKADPSMGELRKAVEADDIEQSFIAVHTLKGVAANLSFTALYKAASELTEQLRSKKNVADKQLMEILEKTYDSVIAVISEFEAEK